MSRCNFPQFNKCTHYGDIHLNRSFTSQHAGQHSDSLLGKSVWKSNFTRRPRITNILSSITSREIKPWLAFITDPPATHLLDLMRLLTASSFQLPRVSWPVPQSLRADGRWPLSLRLSATSLFLEASCHKIFQFINPILYPNIRSE